MGTQALTRIPQITTKETIPNNSCRLARFVSLRLSLSVFIRGKKLVWLAVQIALQQNRRRGLVHLVFPLATTHLCLRQKAVRLHRGQPFIEGFDGNRNRVLQDGNKLLHLERRRTVTAVHVPWHSYHDQFHLLVAEDFLQPDQEFRERFRRDKLQGLGDHPQLVADGDAHSFRAMVNREDAHIESLPVGAVKTLLFFQENRQIISEVHFFNVVCPHTVVNLAFERSKGRLKFAVAGRRGVSTTRHAQKSRPLGRQSLEHVR